MESFPDRALVRLRNREQGMYLHADEDGWAVTLSPHRASLNTAWVVHLAPLHQHPGAATYVLLHSAAYGRYLGVRNVPEDAPPQAQAQGVLVVFVRRMVQCLYNAPVQPDVMWEALSTPDGTGDVFLRLLGNGNPNDWSNSPWTVEAIPPRPAPPQLPQEVPNGVAPVVQNRLIRYIRADNFGIFIRTSRGMLQFEGQHLRDLIVDLADQFGDGIDNITVCVKAGAYGRITPLVVDLPFNEEPVDIVVLATGSAAAMELQHPDVDAA